MVPSRSCCFEINDINVKQSPLQSHLQIFNLRQLCGLKDQETRKAWGWRSPHAWASGSWWNGEVEPWLLVLQSLKIVMSSRCQVVPVFDGQNSLCAVRSWYGFFSVPSFFTGWHVSRHSRATYVKAFTGKKALRVFFLPTPFYISSILMECFPSLPRCSKWVRPCVQFECSNGAGVKGTKWSSDIFRQVQYYAVLLRYSWVE